MCVKKVYILLLCFLSASILCSQTLTGSVYGLSSEGESPLEGVNLLWLGTSVGTTTDEKGNFSLSKVLTTNQLVVRYVGFQKDTLTIDSKDNHIKIVLTSSQELQAVTVSSMDGVYISSKPILTQVITTEGLRRAACCNLSESFESTASVDVSYTDAVSGAKQIQMLGLAGIYSQMMLENTPYIRAMSIPFGLMYVPGAWMESISISKGTSSVINGYESITGQIDIGYKKPETSTEKLFLNMFLNSMLKTEVNANANFEVNEQAQTMLLAHVENQAIKLDHNHDGFTDVPLNTQVNVMNRWDYDVPQKMEGRIMASYLYDTRLGGQMAFKRGQTRDSTAYGLGVDNHKVNLIAKNGILLNGENESIGTIAAFTFNDYKAFYGFRDYKARQISAYANAFYENFLDKKNRHKIDAGMSFQIDDINEQFENNSLQRTEIVPGIFGQYSFILDEKFIAVAGFRLDYNTVFGLLWTPRLHCKWQMAKNSSLRLSIGKGYRSANIYIENTALMASVRQFVVEENLKIEEAYNMGASFTQTFKINGNESSFSVDYFYTTFQNQVIVDIDRNPQIVYFYNLHGKSYAHAAQVDLTLSPLKRFEIMLAYRFNYTVETQDNKLREIPLQSRHKAILNLNYATKFERWKFNVTLQLHGKSRLPDDSSLPENLRWGTYSPTFLTMNAQISKKFKSWEVYLGAENMTNYTQKTPIVDAQNPFGNYFDASVVYAPITGAMVYIGARYVLKDL